MTNKMDATNAFLISPPVDLPAVYFKKNAPKSQIQAESAYILSLMIKISMCGPFILRDGAWKSLKVDFICFFLQTIGITGAVMHKRESC
jgi:hypothetical protein